MPTTIDRETIAIAIAHQKAKYDRMPAHWEARRIEVMREIEALIDRWILAEVE